MRNARLLIDAGGTRYKLGLSDNGKLVKTTYIPSLSNIGFSVQLPEIERVFKQWLPGCKPDSIGLAFAGFVNYDCSKVISVNGKFHDAVDFDFEKWVSTEFNCPVVLEDDAREALIGK